MKRNATLLTCLVMLWAPAQADPGAPGIRKGPAKISLENGLAELNLPKGFEFADKKTTKKLLTESGNKTDGNEIGSVFLSKDPVQRLREHSVQPLNKAGPLASNHPVGTDIPLNAGPWTASTVRAHRYTKQMSEDTYKEFQKAVNMQPAELEKWLDTDPSREVGQKKNGGESTGHRSGRNTLRILRRKKAEFTPADERQMRRTVSYIHRHLAQKPEGDVRDTPWRYSLMNWGHDPLKA